MFKILEADLWWIKGGTESGMGLRTAIEPLEQVLNKIIIITRGLKPKPCGKPLEQCEY